MLLYGSSETSMVFYEILAKLKYVSVRFWKLS